MIQKIQYLRKVNVYYFPLINEVSQMEYNLYVYTITKITNMYILRLKYLLMNSPEKYALLAHSCCKEH